MITLNTQLTLATTSGNAGQVGGRGGSSGATISGGNIGQSVDRNLFYNTGIMRICK
jgi:hypothetical protein